jgi:hypothetical protein
VGAAAAQGAEAPSSSRRLSGCNGVEGPPPTPTAAPVSSLLRRPPLLLLLLAADPSFHLRKGLGPPPPNPRFWRLAEEGGLCGVGLGGVEALCVRRGS